MITTLIAIAVFVAYAWHQAEQDKGGKPNAQHAPDWRDRAAFSLFVAGVLTLMHQCYLVAYHDAAIEFGAMGRRLLGLCLVAYGSFSVVFRWRLNKLRNMSPWYVSPSNAYDTAFIHMVSEINKDALPAVHRLRYADNMYGYVTDVHRAGRIAYCCELAAAIAGALIINL